MSIKMDEKNYENKGKEEEKPQKYLSPRISFRGLGLVKLFEPDISTLRFNLLGRREE
jgi:hypothetical protein